MPRPARPSADRAEAAETPPSFEEALAKLEEIVREMEGDQIPLEELLDRYEEGTRLRRLCEDRLESARGRIELLRKNRNGEDVFENFGAPAEEEGAPTANGEREHDGELF
jgi:exodeoxyribonuclease VII small subunit